MRKLFAVVVVLSVIGCGKNNTATSTPKKAVHPPQTTTQPADLRNVSIKRTLPLDFDVLERSAMGARLGTDGNVYESQEVFSPGQPVYVTMWLKESPGGLQTSAMVTNAKGERVAWPLKQMNGAKVATLKIDTTKFAPGEYKVECLWGMNPVRDYTFKIESGGKKKR